MKCFRRMKVFGLPLTVAKFNREFGKKAEPDGEAAVRGDNGMKERI
ncbi:hypothetical protein [Saccharibacillus alkalitolerans]|uniref:Uncharacterized protein n=1 Tax=Saccharibacillus alkalitolerans TaxID=2705290 RepID=A0ABX0FBK9_9BACL|nr:hypothetical protein [Saccharibacillus alkalitolerans]NGZ76631.1 hypothetical protein [Saccharibacillus alkalitolerans]